MYSMFTTRADMNYSYQLVKIVCLKKDEGRLYKNGILHCEVKLGQVTDCNTIYGDQAGDYRFEIEGPATLYQFYNKQLVKRIEVNKVIEFNITKHTFGVK